jgi:cold shock protein
VGPALRVFLELPGRTGFATVREQEIVMSTGTIKKLVSERGFGFIAADDGKEYFFHRSGIDGLVNFDTLLGGEKVTFDIEPSPKGPRANRVRPA